MPRTLMLSNLLVINLAAQDLTIIVANIPSIHHFTYKLHFFSFQISSSAPVMFLPMLIHKQSPVKVKLQFKSIPSCMQSNIFVFSSLSHLECLLTNDSFENGTTACVYSCADTCSSKITVGFVTPLTPLESWHLCEVWPL